ncbi:MULTISPECIES: hypothetical protein [Nonomuraea]|jgi:hypothetical protein|uniref:Uncharacterized protein n=2 Tax=Nonomuraea TaxID=83681 RepID=A0ABW1BVQ5_9ACTN|nr:MULTISPECIES: hypothetical protein [Nonomuraea]MDA0645558.1 hypothetical protein [Nonomuraea ferruginea]TXK38380.1 hypothetical protein FR742_01295 [Nonomuraea sp. C10]
MLRRIIRNRRPAPRLTGISLEEELALLRVELMYGLRVDRDDYLRMKAGEREEVVARLRGRDAATSVLAELRGSLERAVHPAGLRDHRPGEPA